MEVGANFDAAGGRSDVVRSRPTVVLMLLENAPCAVVHQCVGIVWRFVARTAVAPKKTFWPHLTVAFFASSIPSTFNFGAGGKSRIDMNSDMK